MTTTFLLLASLALLVYAIERHHRRISSTPHGWETGTGVDDRDTARLQHDLLVSRGLPGEPSRALVVERRSGAVALETALHRMPFGR